MGDFRLEDLWAIVQGLLVVTALLFGGMALIALWPKIRIILGLLFRVGAWRLTPALTSLAMEIREQARGRRVKPFGARALTNQARRALNGLYYVEHLPRTDERERRTNEQTRRDRLWGDFLLDRTREKLIAVLVQEDLTVSEIRGLVKGESAVIGQEIEAARQRFGKALSQPYRTPIADRPTAAQFDGDLQYHPPPGGS